MKKSHLKSSDLLPIQQKDRKLTKLGYSFMWVGMVVVLATFAIGGAGVQSLSLPLVIPCNNNWLTRDRIFYLLNC